MRSSFDYWQLWLVKWQTYRYNYKWSNYVHLFDGWLARSAFAVPFVGYLVLFNDSISGHISFDVITKGELNESFLTSYQRLRIVYFGLVLLGLSSAIYWWRRPFVHRKGRDVSSYMEKALKDFVIRDYININDEIQHHGHRTPYGKYYTDEYEKFLRLALGKHGRDSENVDKDHANWTKAKEEHEGLIRSMLIEFYFRNDIKRRQSLTVCIVLSYVGYSFLLLSSMELFVRIVLASI